MPTALGEFTTAGGGGADLVAAAMWKLTGGRTAATMTGRDRLPATATTAGETTAGEAGVRAGRSCRAPPLTAQASTSGVIVATLSIWPRAARIARCSKVARWNWLNLETPRCICDLNATAGSSTRALRRWRAICLVPALSRDRCGVGVLVAVPGARVGLSTVGIERLEDGFLRVLGQQVQVLPDPGLATGDRLALRHAGGGQDLRRHTLDLLDTAVDVAGLQVGLLLGHRGLVLFLRHTDRPDTTPVEELLDNRLVAGQQHLTRAEHHQLAAEQHAHVVRHRAGDVDVVRHDQDRAVDLSVDVDQQLAQVGGTNRVQTRVGLVTENDLRVEHQRAGQAGAFAHTTGDLTGELLLIPAQTHHLQLLHDDVTDLAFLFLGVLAQRKGGVVVEVHRPEQGAVLEHHTEQRADVVKLLGRALSDVGAVDEDRAALRAQQADQRLQEDGLTRTRRAQQNADLALRDLQRDIFPDSLGPEGLRQSLDRDTDAHPKRPSRRLAFVKHPRLQDLNCNSVVAAVGTS